MRKFKYLKSLFKSSEDSERYSNYLLLQACILYNIHPSEFVQYADGELFDVLGDVLSHISPLSQNTLDVVIKSFESDRNYKPFLNKDIELDFHQAVVFSYAINKNLRPIDVKNLEILPPKPLKPFYLHNSLNFLADNKHDYIKKSWEKDLIDYLKGR